MTLLLGCSHRPIDPPLQAAPKAPVATASTTYELTVVRYFWDAEATLTYHLRRQGDRVRVESRTGFFGSRAKQAAQAPARQDPSATFYDFAEQKVYWSGFPGMNALPGGCSWGHYRALRAPITEDFVTGTASLLEQMANGRARQAEGTAVVGGIAAHRVRFVGGTPPKDAQEAANWPVWVFLADEGGTLVKAEAMGPDGKPITLFEVTRLSFGTPGGKPIDVPTGCTSGNSEMDDAGPITAHAEMKNPAVVSQEATLGSDASSTDPIGALTLSVTPVAAPPKANKCGQILSVTGDIVVKAGGPVSLRYRWIKTLEGAESPPSTPSDFDLPSSKAPRSVSLAHELTFEKSGKGEVALEGSVVEAGGRVGPPRRSKAVPFQIRCTRNASAGTPVKRP